MLLKKKYRNLKMEAHLILFLKVLYMLERIIWM
nr:MAG TPA: hypothetical protein [Crassvirales sp.]